MKLKRMWARLWWAAALVLAADIAMSFALPGNLMPLCLLVMAVCFGVIFFCDRKIRCPKCGEHIGAMPPMGRKIVRKCVRCGTPLLFDDQPDPGKTPSPKEDGKGKEA